MLKKSLQELANSMEGELFYDDSSIHQGHLLAYATDASVYQEKPLTVAIPKNEQDVILLVAFANKHGKTLIPRAAGTSLAGQVVGNGIIVDCSKYFNEILEINVEEKWVRLQPGVIRDDLNKYLLPFGLMFGPETSTANRAMIGGMIGNNSCGLHSIVWGNVRDHLLESKVVLSDGSIAILNQDSLKITHSNGKPNYLSEIEKSIIQLLSEEGNKELITSNFPKKSVVRRNTGYALDTLLEMQPINEVGRPFNLSSLIAGSEGTLAMITECKLQLLPLPPKYAALVCIHCQSIKESLVANSLALKYNPMASELVDKCILDFTIGHPVYSKNRFFIDADPTAILMVEFMADSEEELNQLSQQLISCLQQNNCGYAYPVLKDKDASLAWDLRKAGLGLLRNAATDLQPVNLIEDCAVAPEDLPAYIEDLQLILKRYNVTASFYAHAGAGELHVEPLINLKTKEGVFIFRNILKETATLIKKYNGSLSGEHGDGRLRGEFIATVMGEEVMNLFKEVKRIFDPNNIFNAGKIVNTPAMDSHLRMKQDDAKVSLPTNFKFNEEGGILKLAEKCSGSGDCRRSVVSGGLMCPSYMATRNEFNTTRARANVLRQFLSDSEDSQPFNHQEIKEVMDLCLSCKGCKTECPSGVDVTKMKAEFLQQFYLKNGIPFRSQLIGYFSNQMRLASLFPTFYNLLLSSDFLRKNINTLIGFHPNRTMPLLEKETLLKWAGKRTNGEGKLKRVYLFVDEFTNYLDVSIGKKAILLLEKLGYEVIIPKHKESGRTFLSKGMVAKAKEIANHNIQILSPLVSTETPIIGIEPSAILTIRDEYKDLATAEWVESANQLAANTFTIEEFLFHEMNKGNIRKQQFSKDNMEIVFHTHCYQKVLSSSKFCSFVLGFPENYIVKEIPSGCCGMAGAFGYEKEHYEVSQKVGELVLFPFLRKINKNIVVVAAGTSCRHQIKDGVGLKALHPVEILYNALTID